MDIEVRDTSEQAGSVAGRLAAEAANAVIRKRGTVRVLFASAPSQEHMLATFVAGLSDLAKVEALHLDEYIGIDPDHSAGFGKWLIDRIGAAPTLHRLDSLADPYAEVERYSALIRAAPIDLALVGIGVNGHIAFNEPHNVAPPDVLVRVVDLTYASRQQQVDDGCFVSLDEVPTTALTLTPEAILSAGRLICTVVGHRKASAVKKTVEGEVTDACPASILQTHAAATLVLDSNAASQLSRR